MFLIVNLLTRGQRLCREAIRGPRFCYEATHGLRRVCCRSACRLQIVCYEGTCESKVGLAGGLAGRAAVRPEFPPTGIQLGSNALKQSGDRRGNAGPVATGRCYHPSMAFLACHSTARVFWRTRFPIDKGYRALESVALESKDLAINGRPDWQALGRLYGITIDDEHPFHALLPTAAHRRPHPGLRCHVWGGGLPSSACLHVKGDGYVTSPCMDFIMAAAGVSLPRLIAYGNELCGLYSFDSNAERGFRQRKVPLATKHQLAGRIDANPSRPGIARARRALKYIIENSASPMESTVEMLLCLPCCYGGYGLPVPSMNHRIQLPRRSSSIARKGYCYGDLCYPHAKVDIEYHGRYDHDKSGSFESDRARTNGLVDAGYEVVELTSSQIWDFDACEAIALSLASKLGKRIRRENLGALPRRVALRKELLDWYRTSGSL